MPRVCWIFEFPTISGGENSLLACLPAIRAAGIDVAALAPGQGALADRLRASHVEVISFHVRAPSGSQLSRDQRRPRDDLHAELKTQLAALRPDLVHANSLSMSRLVAPVTKAMNIPAIGHLRDIVKLSGAAIADLNRLNRLIAVSAATRDWHVRQGLNEDIAHVSHNGVDPEAFQARAPTSWLHSELGITPESWLIAAIGQLIIRKGHDVFLQAAARIAREHDNVHFLLIGERYSGKEEAIAHVKAIEHAAKSPPLEGRFHMLGYRRDVPRILPELTGLVHTARQEPLGRVLLEAAACGIPMVATDVGGTREIFPPDANAAILVPPDDADATASAMHLLLNDDGLRITTSQNARRRAEAAFNARHAAERLVNHYREVMASR